MQYLDAHRDGSHGKEGGSCRQVRLLFRATRRRGRTEHPTIVDGIPFGAHPRYLLAPAGSKEAEILEELVPIKNEIVISKGA
jgi:hypothetical protein